MTAERLDNLLKRFQKNGPASPDAVDAFEQESSVQLPIAYREFLFSANGGEGFIGSDSYAMLWKVEELLRFNREYQVDEYAPGLLLFGSSGGGEAFAFDMRREDVQPVVSVPFVGMDLSETLVLADTFDGFLEHLEDQ
jgi:hypothetical protein